MYEEAILTVVTVRDFTQVFDSYAQFEESMIAAKMETTAEMGQDEDGACGLIHIGNCPCSYFSCHAFLTLFPLLPEDIDLELRLARFEELIARRPLLLNSVLLRQNPHNVHEWHKRVKLYEGNPRQVSFRPFPTCFCANTIHSSIQFNKLLHLNLLQIINTYTEAVQTVDPMKATGKPHSLWVSFAKFYEENEQLDDVSHCGLSIIISILETLCNSDQMPFLFLICLTFTYCHSGQDHF